MEGIILGIAVSVPTMEDIILAIGVGVLIFTLLWWYYAKSYSVLEQWATESGYRLVSHEYRYSFKGPFSRTTPNNQTVYYVRVEDRHGNRRSGWVRCGGWFWGLLSDNVEVRWDDA
jgi:hypothetical protein